MSESTYCQRYRKCGITKRCNRRLNTYFFSNLVQPRLILNVICYFNEFSAMSLITYAFCCLDCRKSFKRAVQFGDYPREFPCLECGGVSYNFGRHFKPPKKSNNSQWRKIRFLFDHGFRFQKIRVPRSSVPSIPYPATLEEARDFVVRYADYAVDYE